MQGLCKNHSKLVLQLIADVLSVISADVLYELLPRCSHLIWGCLVSTVKHIVAESSAESTLRCLTGISVVQASSATKSTLIVVAASTAATTSSASSVVCRCYNQSSSI